jgi:hypothetical protein
MHSPTTPFRPSHFPYKINAIFLTALLSYPAAAAANIQDPGASMLSLSGFGTFGLVHSSEERADFTASPLAPNGAGYTHSWSPDIDSRFGAQVIAHFDLGAALRQDL